MKTYKKTHTSEKALLSHKKKLKNRGAIISIDNLTITYYFTEDMPKLGTPVYFVENGKEYRGEVVLKDKKYAVSLYNDKNYSGPEKRVIFPDDWSTVESF